MLLDRRQAGVLEELRQNRDRHRWFAHVRREFTRRAVEFADKPIMYVEIGVWYGASARWVIDNVLTHPDSCGYGVDPYPADKRYTWRQLNAVKRFAARALNHPRFELVYEDSKAWLRACPVRRIDLLYLDGSHLASDVLQDFCLAWPLLEVGSGVILDDWYIGRRKSPASVAEAVEAIRIAFGGMVEPWGQIGENAFQYSWKVVSKDPRDAKYKWPKGQELPR